MRMERNRLVDGETRVGYIDVNDDAIPLLPARLDRRSDRILLTIPYLYEDAGRRLDRWFNADAHWLDDPDKTRYEYAPPTELDFSDRQGSISLVGCRPVGGTMSPTGVSEGSVTVRFAIRGARNAPKYRTINGLRSEVDGLGTWMNLRSLQVVHERDEEGRLQSATLRLKSPEELALTRKLNLRVRPAFLYGPGEHPDETVVTERMLIESDVRAARGWYDHLDLHIGLRDLVRVASWRPLKFLKHEVTRDDDPRTTIDGAPHGRQWLPVETFVTGADSVPSKIRNLDYLFTFDQIGRRGVGRWLRLRRDWSRAIGPIVDLVNLREASLEVHFAQLCIGFEALGYLLAREAGVGKSTAGDENFHSRLERIVNDLNFPMRFGGNDWATSATKTYRQVKHANNRMPEFEEMYRAYYRGVHVFRAWIAGRLGVPRRTYEKRQGIDRIARVANRAG